METDASEQHPEPLARQRATATAPQRDSMLSTMADTFHFSFSIVVIGDTNTGKSRLISCTVPGTDTVSIDPQSQDPGADHGVRCKAHTYESRGARYQVLMWEVPGAPRYLSVVPRYAAMAAGAFFVFDLTRRVTFDRVSQWLEAVETSSPELPSVLVGNKCDGETEVSTSEAYELAKRHGCKYFETCALKNEQVPEAFSSIIARIVSQIPNPPEPSLLLRKRIQIGRQLAENKSFRAALFDIQPPPAAEVSQAVE